MRVLLVKMSSLGDVVHTLPAVTDLAAQGAEIHWVVEEAFVPIAAAHRGVQQVLPVAWRRWRKSLPAFWSADAAKARAELGAFRRALRETHFDLVIDAQGLFKSAVVTQQARAPRKAGLDKASAREPGAARFYTERYPVPRAAHAVDRVRALVSQAAGYALPAQCDFGLQATSDSGALPDHGRERPVALLLHGTTWDSKHYPEPQWHALIATVAHAGFEPAVTWGDAREQRRAEQFAQSGATIWPRMPLAQLIERLRTVAVVIGVDSGIAHLAGALGVPTVALYGPTDAALTGVRGARSHSLQAELGCVPCLARQCQYQGPAVLHEAQPAEPACFGTLPPARIWQAAQRLLGE